MQKKITNLSVVVPVYCSQNILSHLVERLAGVLPNLVEDYELILVNDASPDQTWDVVVAMCKKHNWIKGIHLSRNFGQHNTLLCGIRHARFDLIATMDDDLQNPPEELEKLLRAMEEGCDVVYGYPQDYQQSLWRRFSSALVRCAMVPALGAKNAMSVSPFRVFRARLCRAFQDFAAPNVSLDVLLSWGTTRFAAIPVAHARRLSGQSTYSLTKLLDLAMSMLIGFSVLPLRLAGLMGFLFAIFGLLVLGFVLVRFLFFGSVVPGFTFLASIVAIFSGVQLLILGIIGEYMARTHFNSTRKPPYVIMKTVGFDDSCDNQGAHQSQVMQGVPE
ncbi:MAG: glycosyltransferase [Magnetococcales bacterium]|nr:glycosyltransferase [Magnetococcales bacterium]MBF0321835.1 glycosyltransferase [Magnetococcales bacterium]